jgi:transglutaminase-like putative cysteine protease
MLARIQLSFGTQVGVDSQRLYWSMFALGISLLAHLSTVPVWIVLLIGATAVWRILIESHAWRLPPRWLRTTIALSVMAAVAVTFKTLNGLEAGTALLSALAGVKLLETRGTRDCTMVLLIGYVLLFAALLFDQSLLRLPYIFCAAWILTAALLRLQKSDGRMLVRAALRTSGRIVLQALPIAILLFLFFPRLPGQFWSLPTRNSAATGINDEMSPGDIAELTISTNPAFRVKFTGPLPPQRERYWRGPVLHEFDGRRWSRETTRLVAPQTVIGEGVAYAYRLTLEPTQRPWVFALDIPTVQPELTVRLFDFQLVARRPVTSLTSFELQSHTNFRVVSPMQASMRRLDTSLPGASNPKSRAYAVDLREQAGSDEAYVNAVLAKFRNESFFYTLTPPTLGDDSVDEFLFETRKGFCEHYASAFTMLMRAAGIPARVVTGYQGGEFNSLGEYLLVRQSDAHAWSEVWLADRGWIRVDPTAAIAPQRIERNIDSALSLDEFVPGRFARTNPFLSRARQSWDAINNFWNDRVLQYNEMRQRSLMALLGIKDAGWREMGVAIGVSLALFFAALTAHLAWRYRPRNRDPVLRVYERLCAKLAREKLARESHEGPIDFLRRATMSRPDLSEQLEQAETLYTQLRYGPDPNPKDLRLLKLIVRRLAA